jgi:hypothetical protein
VQIVYEIEGERQLSRELGIASDHITDWSAPLTKIGSELLKTFDLNFSQRGALFGGWKPRKPQVVRGSRVDTWPLLEKTGHLRRSFNREQGRDWVAIQNTASYFKYHQSNKPRKVLPRRVMMMIDDARKMFIQRTFQEHIIYSTRGLR